MDDASRSGFTQSLMSGKTKTKSRIPSKLSIFMTALAAALAVALVSFAVEQYVEPPRIPFHVVDLADQALGGLFAGGCVLALRLHSRRQHLLDRQRFELISESTKQIRDALQLITDSAIPGSQQQHVIIYAVDHIEWVLQEVLPAVHQDPKEVRDRVRQYS